MKNVFYAFSMITFLFFSCNNKPVEEKPSSGMPAGSSQAVTDTAKIKDVFHTFNNVDPKISTSLNGIIDSYLKLKDALANNDADAAASNGKAMREAMKNIDKSLFTAEQKKVYDDIEDDLEEHAEHIGKNAGKIEHQREHLSMMSEDMYDLVRAFGSSKPLYVDYCSMAMDNKGALWLNEKLPVSNPYFGGKMNECVTVRELIK